MRSTAQLELRRPRGAVFPTPTPFYAIASFARRITAPGAHRGWRRPRDLIQARRDAWEDESAERLAHLLTLDPDLLIKVDSSMPPLVRAFYSQLGRHREALVTAQTPHDRDVAKRWITIALLSSSVTVDTYSLPDDQLVDRAERGDAEAWNMLIHRYPLSVLYPGIPDEQAATALQHLVVIRIARHICGFIEAGRGNAHTSARVWLTKVFLQVGGKRLGNALAPEDINSVYQMCLDWLVHLDRTGNRPRGRLSVGAARAIRAHWRREVDDVKSQLPRSLWMRLLQQPKKEGAFALAGHLLGCSAEQVRRSRLGGGNCRDSGFV